MKLSVPAAIVLMSIVVGSSIVPHVFATYTWSASGPSLWSISSQGSTIPITTKLLSGAPPSITVGWQAEAHQNNGCGSIFLSGYTTKTYTANGQSYTLKQTVTANIPSGCYVYVAAALYDQSTGAIVGYCGSTSSPSTNPCYTLQH